MWNNCSLSPRGLLILGCLCLVGCGDGDQIQRYRVTEPDLQSEADLVSADRLLAGRAGTGQQQTYAARMLAAMMPQAGQTWYFKLLGPDEAVAVHETAFREFIRSIRFAGGKPTWTLPEGWRQRPGADMRFATLLVGDDRPPLELTVIGLGTVGEYGDDYVLKNVNRWRHDQLGLDEITLAELPDEIEQIEIDGVTATVVSLEGRASVSGEASRPPFASGGLPIHGGMASPTVSVAPRPSSGAGFTYDTPEGWQPGRPSAMRRAAFVVSDGDKQVEVTVFRFPPSGLLENVNRWRKEIGLKETTAERLDDEVQTIPIGEVDAHYARLAGEKETTLGVMVNRPGASWFFKLRGDPALAEREREHFEAFVKSVRFE